MDSFPCTDKSDFSDTLESCEHNITPICIPSYAMPPVSEYSFTLFFHLHCSLCYDDDDKIKTGEEMSCVWNMFRLLLHVSALDTLMLRHLRHTGILTRVPLLLLLHLLIVELCLFGRHVSTCVRTTLWHAVLRLWHRGDIVW